MNIIFLDIDGVLCGPQEWGLNKKPELFNSYPFNKKSVKVLNSILHETKADIVLSSDWRRYHDLKEIQIIFDMNCVCKSPIDFTPELPPISYGWGGSSSLDHNRSREINLYLQKHPEIIKWVAIDDLDLSVSNFVHCRVPSEGIKQTGIKSKILKYFE